MILVLWIAPLMVLVGWWWLVEKRGKAPQDEARKVELPWLPSVPGIVSRLDGIGERSRKFHGGGKTQARADGSVEVPVAKGKKMTAGDLGEVAFVWAVAKWNEENPGGARRVSKVLTRSRILPLLTVIVCLLAAVAGRLEFKWAVTIALYVWMFVALTGIQNVLHFWKLTSLAEQRLIETGLMPGDSLQRDSVESALRAQPWRNMPGWII